MSNNNSTNKWQLWIGVVGLIAALLGLLTAYVQYRDRLAEIELRKKADTRATEAESRAKQEREVREKLERQQDSIRKFMVNYRGHLLEIKNASSRLRAAKASQVQDKIPQDKIRELEENVAIRVMAFIKFLNDWREVHRGFRPFLNGDADALAAAAKARDVAEMEKRSELLEKNVEDKLRILEEAAKALQ